ncbi:hypothetical protein SNEBB_007736 [Seison nebaliae]|nr:hypothetical protein SNEBB_007736 [Seison nebaliae]
MTEYVSSDFAGYTYLLPICSLIGLSIDRMNFVFCQFSCLIFGGIYRYLLPPKPVYNYPLEESNRRSQLRCLIGGMIGWSIAFYCFGSTIYWLLIQNIITYFLTYVTVKSDYLPHLGVTINMLILSILHIRRMIYDYGGWTLDITGPLMINTQRMTDFVMSFYDGLRHKEALQEGKPSPLNSDQLKQSIQELPSFIQFFGYSFYFHGILIGPFCSYQNYISFIQGTNFPQNCEDTSAKKAITTKVFLCLIYLAITVFIADRFPVNGNLSFSYLSWKCFVYLYISGWLAKPKYYFGWLLGDAINNAAGLGYNGMEDGEPKWDLITNIDIPIVETSTSTKMFMDYWNIGTKNWLRRICYDRLTSNGTLITYILSAMWHGYYPGYYVAFIGAGFCTLAGRSIRKSIRPHFLNTKLMVLYSLITWLGAQLIFNYYSIFVTILTWEDSLEFLNKTFWFLPIISLICIVVLPHRPLFGNDLRRD